MDIISSDGKNKVNLRSKKKLPSQVEFQYEAPVLRSSAKRKANRQNSDINITITLSENSRRTRSRSQKVDEDQVLQPSSQRKPELRQKVNDARSNRSPNKKKQSTLLKYLEIVPRSGGSIESSKLVCKMPVSLKQKGRGYKLISLENGTRVLRSASKGKTDATESLSEDKEVHSAKRKVPKPTSEDKRVLRGKVQTPEPQPVDKIINIRKNNVQKSLLHDKRVNRKKIKTRKSSLKDKRVYKRVTRSTSKETKKLLASSVIAQVNSVSKTGKNKKKAKVASHNEYVKIKKKMRYMLKRMNYERSLLDAYSAEGWRGQSLEKLKPEKELERAKSEILRCKLKIRESFHHLDSLLSEGKFKESLYDSEGEIASEDIFCSKCGSKDLSINNDIILCDGICNRGFHQKCLDPPLLTENIPPGDEGWLCPACDCKIDCLDLLEEFLGRELEIEISWEDIFPEVAAGKQNTDAGDSPDSSDDNDYNPDVPEVDVEDSVKGSHSEESESGSWHRRERFSARGECLDLGLPSEDSEDDDYNPERPDLDHMPQKDGSSSDRSDFTSDSDEFCAEIAKSSLSNKKSHLQVHRAIHTTEHHNSSPNSGSMSFLDGNLHEVLGVRSLTKSNEVTSHIQPNASSIVARRQLERLDYKKLYDEEYGENASGSSDDEEWSGMTTSKKRKKNVGERPEMVKKGAINCNSAPRVRNSRQRLNFATSNNSTAEEQTLNASPSAKVPSPQSKSRVTSQKLLDAFEENQYPSRAEKESLAKELRLTYQQVDKWFGNLRHSRKVSSKEGKMVEVKISLKHSSENGGLDNRAVTPRKVTDATPDKQKNAGTPSSLPTPQISTPNTEKTLVNFVPNIDSTPISPRTVVGKSTSGKKHSAPACENAAPDVTASPGSGNRRIALDNSTSVDNYNGAAAGHNTPGCSGAGLMAASVRSPFGSPSRKNMKSSGKLDLSVEEDRKKAIARELRKMGKRR